jgi:hypothetical protein
MTTLTNKLLSAAFGLAIAFGAAAAMTAATAVVAPTEAAAKGFKGGFKMGGRTNSGQLGRVAIRQPVKLIDRARDMRPVKEVGTGRERVREGIKETIIENGGKKADLLKRLREKKVPGRG